MIVGWLGALIYMCSFPVSISHRLSLPLSITSHSILAPSRKKIENYFPNIVSCTKRKFLNEAQRSKFLQHFRCCTSFFSSSSSFVLTLELRWELNAHVLAQTKPFNIQTIRRDIENRGNYFAPKEMLSAEVRDRKKERKRIYRETGSLAVRLTLRYFRCELCACTTLCSSRVTIFGTEFQWRYAPNRSCSASLFIHVTHCTFLSCCLPKCTLITRTKGFLYTRSFGCVLLAGFFFLCFIVDHCIWWEFVLWLRCAWHLRANVIDTEYCMKNCTFWPATQYLNVWENERARQIVWPVRGGLFNVLT